MRGMRRRAFRVRRRPVFVPRRPWGWRGIGCLLYPALAALVIFLLVLLRAFVR